MGIVEFAWSHSVISDKFYERVKNVCDFRLSPTTNECSHVMNLLFKIYHEIEIYNVYAPRCNTDGSAFLSSFNSSVEKEAKVSELFIQQLEDMKVGPEVTECKL